MIHRHTVTQAVVGASSAIALIASLSGAALARPVLPGGQAPAAKEKPAAAIVNINTATVGELQTLPGVGAATAARILEYRQKNGGFKKIEELMNVRGIGEKTFLKLKPLITITPPKAIGL